MITVWDDITVGRCCANCAHLFHDDEFGYRCELDAGHVVPDRDYCAAWTMREEENGD